MFITPAYAQAGGGSGDLLFSLLPFLIIFIIIYFLIIRPQQRRQKEHQEMISNVRRGDRVVMSGGLMGKVIKVMDDETMKIEIASGVEVEVSKPMIATVRVKGTPATDAPAKDAPAKSDEKS